MQMEKTRLNLKDAVLDLAPPPPPCFLSHLQWREYLVSAAASQNVRGEPKLIRIVNGDPQLNREYPFCEDCTQAKSHEMMTKGRCKPDFLKEMP